MVKTLIQRDFQKVNNWLAQTELMKDAFHNDNQYFLNEY